MIPGGNIVLEISRFYENVPVRELRRSGTALKPEKLPHAHIDETLCSYGEPAQGRRFH